MLNQVQHDIKLSHISLAANSLILFISSIKNEALRRLSTEANT